MKCHNIVTISRYTAEIIDSETNNNILFISKPDNKYISGYALNHKLYVERILKLMAYDLKKMSPELEFVLSCINSAEVPEEVIASLNWNMVLNLAVIHSIFPLVYNTISRLNYPTVPKNIVMILQQKCIRSAIIIVGLADEIVRIVKDMEHSGVQPIILKGPPLSIKINEDIALRASSDIDILVDPAEFQRAEKILEKLEYRRISPNFSLTPRQQKNFFKKDHHFEYVNDKRAIKVELHWRIRSFNIKHFPSVSDLNTQKINVAGFAVPVMGNEYWLIYLMVHGYKHMWVRLRWLYDIKIFIEQNINWKKIITIAENTELKPILHQTLILLNTLFEVPIPQCLKQSVANDKKAWQLYYAVMEELCTSKNNSYNPTFMNNFTLKKINYFDFNSKFSNRLYYLLTTLKPRDIDYKLISLPDILFPLYYFIKPIYWFLRYIGILRTNK